METTAVGKRKCERAHPSPLKSVLLLLNAVRRSRRCSHFSRYKHWRCNLEPHNAPWNQPASSSILFPSTLHPHNIQSSSRVSVLWPCKAAMSAMVASLPRKLPSIRASAQWGVDTKIQLSQLLAGIQCLSQSETSLWSNLIKCYT